MVLTLEDRSVPADSNPLDEQGLRGAGVRDVPGVSARLPDLHEADYTGDRHLDLRIRNMLDALQRLSEQQAKPTESNRGKAESRPPISVAIIDSNWDRPLAPRKDESLYIYYRWHFEQVKRLTNPSDEELIVASDRKAEVEKKRGLRRTRLRRQLDLAVVYLFLAERDYRRHYKGAPDQATNEQRKSEREIDFDILAYEGVSSLEVALVTGYKVSQIEKLRGHKNRDKETGYPRQDRGTFVERRERARTLKRDHPHLSLSQIAMRLGVSKAAVVNYLRDDLAA